MILLASLAGNVVLAALLMRAPSSSSPVDPGSAEIRAESQTATVRKKTPAAAPVGQEMTVTESETLPAFNWSQLESQDYKEYIARLRAFGVPEKTVRDIIFADVAKLYRPRFAALRPPPATRTNFWEESTGYPSPRQTKEQREQLRALQKEQQELLKTLLGENVHDERTRDAGGIDWFERNFSMVPGEHRDKVKEMQGRYQDIVSEIHERAAGYHDQDIQAELKAARKKFRDELSTVLTPPQLEDYELRTSDVASNMRYQLKTFEPNEDEFRSIFRYKQTMEEINLTRADSDPNRSHSPEEIKAHQQKQKEAEETLAQALGTERGKEFKFSEQYEYRNLMESGVPKESIVQLAEMREQVESAAGRLRQDKTLSNEQRNEAFAAMRAETEKELAGLLGDRRARSYSANGGHWLRNLAPRQ